MLGRFPSKLNPVFLLGFTNHEVKFPNSFVRKLKCHFPVSNSFSNFLDDCKRNTNDNRIAHSGDTNSYAPNNCTCGFCMSKGIPIS